METTYCVICCGEYPHIGDDLLCEKCDNSASSGIMKKDFKRFVGFSDELMSDTA